MTSPTHPPELADLLDQLQAHGYRYTRPLQQRQHYSEPGFAAKTVKAVILDTETTGVDPQGDQIIELGMVAFEYDPESGRIGQVYGSFDALEDPGRPIPPESTKVHHITDDMVRGKRIDDDAVAAFLAGAALVIAHNARFDRRFVETRFPIFRELPWACSFAQIPWTEEGYGSGKLEFLAYRAGFHYEGHRASIDCQAVLEVLHHAALESGTMPLQWLLLNARKKEYALSALNSPFESKDQLKARRYRWNAERKLWTGNVAQEELQAELAWLKDNVYQQRAFSVDLERIDAYNRFSSRAGEVERVSA